METLEIMLDKDAMRTTYCILNKEVKQIIFFEGGNVNGKKVTPLSEAKKWARANGYKKLLIISHTLRKQDKTYDL